MGMSTGRRRRAPHAVHGAIGSKYAATVFETDAYGNDVQQILGAPTSDEMDAPGLPGVRMNTFQGGAIYWSAANGAHAVSGAIGAEYGATANETDYWGTNVQQILGAPTSDEFKVPGVQGAREQAFQGGASTGRPAPAPMSSTEPSAPSTTKWAGPPASWVYRQVTR